MWLQSEQSLHENKLFRFVAEGDGFGSSHSLYHSSSLLTVGKILKRLTQVICSSLSLIEKNFCLNLISLFFSMGNSIGRPLHADPDLSRKERDAVHGLLHNSREITKR